MESKRIALDVMGGDNAPGAMLEGAVLACDAQGSTRLAPERVLLVGDESVIRKGLEALGNKAGFSIQHASQVIEMGESPAQALRGKPDSSIAGCVGAVRQGAAGALVSMGNTGAVVGAATIGLKTLEGVKRPGIAVTLDLTGHPVTLLDMGANIAPKPQHLYQYGVMGSVYMHACVNTAQPRVGLLNIGEEAGKGTDLLKATHELMTAGSLRFAGNIEGGDIFHDKVEVVVTDGFTGNVVLKLLENFAAFMMMLVLRELKAHDVQWSDQALAHVRKNIDYSEYGGALLLGVAGTVVIGHGRSDAAAVANALGLAARTMDAGVNEEIVKGLARTATGA